MESIVYPTLREHVLIENRLLKCVVQEGDGNEVTMSSRIDIYQEIYQEDQLLISAEKLSYTLIQYEDESDVSAYDQILRTMKINETAWVKIAKALHTVKDKIWDDLWFKITILNSEPDLDIIIPNCLECLRTQEIELPEGRAIKRVIKEGVGEFPTVDSRIKAEIAARLPNGSLIESIKSVGLLLTRLPGPGFHKGCYFALKEMRKLEEAWIYCPRYLHLMDYSCGIWVFMRIIEIEMNTNILIPQNQPFVREENLLEGGDVIKRVVKEGKGPLLPDSSWEIWIKYEGRMENGYEFQKSNSVVANSGKMYSQA